MLDFNWKGVGKMTKIRCAHFSDHQIRTLKRHKEYRKAHENLFTSFREQKPDMIVIPGDLAHEKSHTSPELFDIFCDLFVGLSDIAPVHLIPGNHDLVMKNLSRLDTLTPIIKAINRKNIHYYKHSGVYKNDLCSFVVFSCCDKDELWPTIKDINPNDLNIGLFHGMIQGAKLQNGQIVEESYSPYKLKKFLDMVDYLMLGDIHSMQILDLHYKAAYCRKLSSTKLWRKH